METFPWLTTIGLLPLVGSLLLAALPAGLRRLSREIALGVSLLVLGAVVYVALQFDVARGGEYQFTETASWIPQFGVSYALGLNGIGLVMVVLSAILVPVCILASWHDAGEDPQRLRLFFALVLVLETMIIGVFAARDVFLFYVFFEAMLIPMYFLIGSFGGAQGKFAAMKFLLFSLAGGLIMLVALIGLVLGLRDPATGQLAIEPGAFLIENLVGREYGTAVERLLFVGFFIAFAIKAPMWPVHTWLPDAAASSTPGGAVLLVGVLDKVGTFGMITLCLPLFPDASRWAAPVVVVLAVVSVLYGALLAIGQSDLKRLIAFTSISHFGFIVLGIFAMTSSGQAGSVLYMVNHGFSTAALFLAAGMFIARYGTSRIADYGGVQRVTPLLAGSFLVAGLSSLALPGLSSFISEFLVLVGTFVRYPVAAVLATLGIVLAALYILLTYQRMATGPVPESMKGAPDLRAREMWVMAPVLAVIVALGFVPKPVLDVINPAIEQTMEHVGVTDPDHLVTHAEDGADQ